jgi:hypothetical protein
MVEALSFEERLGLLVDREAVERESKRLVSRLKHANLRQNAVVEDLDTKAARLWSVGRWCVGRRMAKQPTPVMTVEILQDGLG